MIPERWRKISHVFHAARAHDPVRRGAFLSDVCAADLELRREVESLIAAADEAGLFGDLPIGVQPLALEPGTTFGPYRIDRLLGSGGMGEVYKAHDTRLDRTVAIKVLAADIHDDPRSRERVRREARSVAALNHPNICTLHDVGDGFLVMELVEGETLRDWFRRGLSQERRLEIACQVLEALAAAHRTGVVHRDLKPENIMVRPDGYVKVLDFGLATRLPTTSGLDSRPTPAARPNRPGEIFGTVAYMSPEQLQGDEIDQRSDLFAFGILLYEMLIGRHPWPRSTAEETLQAILHDDPPPIGTLTLEHWQLGTVLQKLLRKRPADRYRSAGEVLEALTVWNATRRSAAAGATGSKPLISIAVLPFVVLGEFDDTAALSLGFADALITIFANLEDLIVAPTSAILKYHTGAAPADACRELGVRYCLQGTAQQINGRWRVSMQLFDAAILQIALSEKHDFDLPSVFDVQDEVARRIVESLERRLPSGIRRSRDRYSDQPEAYDEFIAGLRDSASDEIETLKAAAEHLTVATRHDPEFALAFATLSMVSTSIYSQFNGQHAWLQQAEDQCSRALALDPALPEGHLARAWILWSPAKNFQHVAAIAALQQVLAARPNLERAHNRMSSICLHIGRLEDARMAHERSQRANSETRSGNLEWFYLMSGDYAHAEEATAAWLSDRPASIYARISYALPALFTGDLDLADERLAAAAVHLPDEPMILSLQGILSARRGQSDLALQCVRRALECPRSYGHTHHTYHYIAGVYAILGQIDTAMAWLERSVDSGWACWSFFKIDPHLEQLRGAPAFDRLIAGLEQTYTALEIEPS